jgi:hypothetical protein
MKLNLSRTLMVTAAAGIVLVLVAVWLLALASVAVAKGGDPGPFIAPLDAWFLAFGAVVGAGTAVHGARHIGAAEPSSDALAEWEDEGQ